MARRPSTKARLQLLGNVLRLLRLRRRLVHSVVIHVDGSIEVRLEPLPTHDAVDATLDVELEQFRRENGY